MFTGEERVKWLDPERRAVLLEARRGHERDGAQATDVPVVNRAAIGEDQLDRRVAAFVVGESAGVDEKRAGEARLHDDAIVARQVDHDELGAPPCPENGRAGDSPRKLPSGCLAEDVCLGYGAPLDAR